MHLVQSRQYRLDGGRKHSGGEVFSVLSGKGGVGKSNLALNLAIQLARRQRRVILVDADFGLGNADILLNVAPHGTFGDVLDPRRDVDELLVDGPAGLRVLCGASDAGDGDHGFSADECRDVVARLRASCDALVLDCGNTLSEGLVALGLASDLLLLATTPEPTALADGYAVLKVLSNRGFASRAGVVVNMARDRREAANVATRLQRVARQFLGLSVEYLGHVPMDRHVPLAVRARVPAVIRYPHCSASVCIDDICENVLPPRRERAARGTVWNRLASLFL